MIQSMTAYASRSGTHGAAAWTWEMRGVNGRGLDLRLRLPDGVEGLEPALRALLTARLHRGNVTLNLRLTRSDAGAGLRVDPAQLRAAMVALHEVATAAAAAGVTLAPPTAADVLSLRGVTVQAPPSPDEEEGLLAALTADCDALTTDFVAMRLTEGAALAALIGDHLSAIESAVDAAATLAEARRDEMRATMAAALRRVFEDVPEMDEQRMAQELAIIAMRADVTEEIGRLRAHVAAARALLTDGRPAGRKLDFLAQEFNREANTLCSKAQSAELTRVGLDLKAVIDQMREQVQNVE